MKSSLQVSFFLFYRGKVRDKLSNLLKATELLSERVLLITDNKIVRSRAGSREIYKYLRPQEKRPPHKQFQRGSMGILQGKRKITHRRNNKKNNKQKNK